MNERLPYARLSPEIHRALVAVNAQLKEGTIEPALKALVDLRVSQINGCLYCLDLHAQQARAAGVSQQKLDCLAAWDEASFYTERERAALHWAETVTRVSESHVPEAIYNEVRPHFSERELADLTFIIAVMNAWNRVAISFRKQPEARPEENR